MAPHWLRLIIRWRDPVWGNDTGFIWRLNGASPSWTGEENEVLRQMYENGDRMSILIALPRRSWRSINYQAHILSIHRSTQSKNNSPIPPTITYEDWEFMQKRGIIYDEKWGKKCVLWSEIK